MLTFVVTVTLPWQIQIYFCFSLSLSNIALQLVVWGSHFIFFHFYFFDTMTGRRGKQLKIIEIVSLNRFDICRKGICISYLPLQYFSNR